MLSAARKNWLSVNRFLLNRLTIRYAILVRAVSFPQTQSSLQLSSISSSFSILHNHPSSTLSLCSDWIALNQNHWPPQRLAILIQPLDESGRDHDAAPRISGRPVEHEGRRLHEDHLAGIARLTQNLPQPLRSVRGTRAGRIPWSEGLSDELDGMVDLDFKRALVRSVDGRILATQEAGKDAPLRERWTEAWVLSVREFCSAGVPHLFWILPWHGRSLLHRFPCASPLHDTSRCILREGETSRWSALKLHAQ